MANIRKIRYRREAVYMSYDILSLIFYFIFYSLIGWLLESTFGTVKGKKFINRGFLYGPFCPIYGFGAILLIIVTNTFLDNILLLFIFSTIAISLLEYTTGYVLETLFHATWWDYSNRPFNLKGRVCLRFSLLWGFLSILFLRLFHPQIIALYKFINGSIAITIIYLVLFYIIVDFILTLNHVLKLTKRLKQLNTLYEDFIDKLENAGENIEKVKEELKSRYYSIFDKIKEEFPRIFTAFPRFSNKIMDKIKKL